MTTTNTYDGRGNLTQSIAAAAAVGGQPALNLTTNYTPNAIGDIETLTSPRNYATTMQYDNMRRKKAEQNRSSSSPTSVPLAAKEWVFDGNGRPTTERRAAAIDGAGIVTEWRTWTTSYTPTGQKADVTDPAGNVIRTIYDALDRPLRTIDGQGRVSQFTYDLAGQKLAELRGVGTPLQQTYATYAYTPNGKEDWVQDAGAGRTDYTYDGFDRLSRTDFPNPATGLPNSSDYEALTYDAQGNVLTRRTRGGATLAMTYDVLDRLWTKAVPAWGAGAARSATYGYDLAGRRTSLAEAGQALSWSYDAAGRESTATINGPLWAGGAKSIITNYNLNSVRNRLTWPDGWSVQYTFDGMDRMIQAAPSDASFLATFTPNPLSEVTAETRPGSTISRSYNLAGDVDTLTHAWSGASVSFGHGYDRSRKLTSRSVSNSAFAMAGPATGSVGYTPDKLNRYSVVGGAGFSYDAAGNLTSDGSSTYGYDAENRLLSATTPLGSGAYTYDPLGRRVGKSVGGGAPTVVLPAGDDEIAAYTSTGTLLRRWAPSPDIDRLIAQVDIASAATSFYRLDRQGSTIGMTNSAGVLTEGPYTYDAYGKPNLTTGTPFRYTGRKYDAETGLYYYRARYYSPTLGRFLQTDPVGYEDDQNLYAFVKGDPVNASDPWGLFESSPWLRALVPGQVYFDQGVTAVEEGRYASAGVYFGGMVGEQLLAVLTFGQGSAGLQGGRAAVNSGGRGASYAYLEARFGGRHAGFLEKYEGLSNREIQKGIQSIGREIAEHENKIANPADYVMKTTGRDWRKLDVREQRGMVEKWRADINRQNDQMDILKDIQNSRNTQTPCPTGSRLC